MQLPQHLFARPAQMTIEQRDEIRELSKQGPATSMRFLEHRGERTPATDHLVRMDVAQTGGYPRLTWAGSPRGG